MKSLVTSPRLVVRGEKLIPPLFRSESVPHVPNRRLNTHHGAPGRSNMRCTRREGAPSFSPVYCCVHRALGTSGIPTLDWWPSPSAPACRLRSPRGPYDLAMNVTGSRSPRLPPDFDPWAEGRVLPRLPDPSCPTSQERYDDSSPCSEPISQKGTTGKQSNKQHVEEVSDRGNNGLRCDSEQSERHEQRPDLRGNRLLCRHLPSH